MHPMWRNIWLRILAGLLAFFGAGLSALALQYGHYFVWMLGIAIFVNSLTWSNSLSVKIATRVALLLVMAATNHAQAAVRTTNFIVRAAPSYEQPLASAAERFRKELAIDWLGHELPDWSQPCPISATIETGMGNGGVTSFAFERGRVFGWQMSIQGSPEMIVESVLQHEVLHTVFASHFLQPLPRWADEGACSTVEGRREYLGSHRRLVQFLRTGRGIAFDQLFAMREYPDDVLPLYDQGRSLTAFLVEHGGKRHFVDFLAVGLRDRDWPGAVAEMYGYADLGQLQTCWLDWFRQGSQLPSKEVRLRAPDT